ncbi:MAG: HNH endonuclease [Sedimentisphaerales bacterium]|nr:HNH endonuclease [Sedimentisphaerales bacterium]
MSATYTITIPEWLYRVATYPLMVYRRLKYDCEFRRIYLGDGEYTIVDPDVFYRLGHHKWYLKGGKRGKFYADRNIKIGPGITKRSGLQREIVNPPPGLVVDHLNRDPLDNRLANLRPATHSQNTQNSTKKKNASSKFFGVWFHKPSGKWCASIRYNGKSIWLGSFDNEIDAALAYDAAARKYYGEFAKVNFPTEPVPALVR